MGEARGGVCWHPCTPCSGPRRRGGWKPASAPSQRQARPGEGAWAVTELLGCEQVLRPAGPSCAGCDGLNPHSVRGAGLQAPEREVRHRGVCFMICSDGSEVSCRKPLLPRVQPPSAPAPLQLAPHRSTGHTCTGPWAPSFRPLSPALLPFALRSALPLCPLPLRVVQRGTSDTSGPRPAVGCRRRCAQREGRRRALHSHAVTLSRSAAQHTTYFWRAPGQRARGSSCHCREAEASVTVMWRSPSRVAAGRGMAAAGGGFAYASGAGRAWCHRCFTGTERGACPCRPRARGRSGRAVP